MWLWAILNMMVVTELPPTPLFRALRIPHFQAAGFQVHSEYTAGTQWSREPWAELHTGCSTPWCSFSREATCALSLPLSKWSRKLCQVATTSSEPFKGPKELPLSCLCLTKHLFRFKPVVYCSFLVCLHRIIWFCSLHNIKPEKHF